MKEETIRPQELFYEFLSLAEKDIETYFRNSPFYYINCPACESSHSSFQFRKMGFDYEECLNCKTLFVNPRPTADAFSCYYEDSPSVRFWATNFYRETAESRRELIIIPKAMIIRDYLLQFVSPFPDDSCVIDIGAGYGIFCEELIKLMQGTKVIAVEPSISLQKICLEKGLKVVSKPLEDMDVDDISGFNLIAATSFELLEHLHNPSLFLSKCSNLLQPGSLLILTTLTWDGFDLQVLREKSTSIHPPHHINFFSKMGMEILLKRYDLEILDLSTPGKLDVEIITKNQTNLRDHFLKKLVTGNENNKHAFQQFLQDNKLSSHMMIVARKN
jgi:2-polyprenyl-3-methyl-5-hydroxy-6-metoxy-1,4-benzoquinol methylase